MEAVERWQAWGAKVFPTVIHTRRGGVEKDWHLKTWPLETWSAAKPGQVPGLIVEGPFVAIDCDSTFAEDYWEDLRLEHMAECHWIEKTLRGHKYIFRLPPGVQLKQGWYGRGIRRFEVLTRFTVAPCYRDGTDSKGVACRYQVLSPEGSEPGPLPPKLLEELVRWSIERRPARESTEDIREDAPVRDPMRYVDALVIRIASLPAGQGERQAESNRLVFQVGRVLHAFSPSQQAVIEEACLQAVLANGLEKDRAQELVPRALKDGAAKPKPVQVSGVQAAPTPPGGVPVVDPYKAEALPTFERGGDFVAHNFPPARWLVPGFLPANALGTIAGPSFTGKTLLGLWAAAEALRYDATAVVAYILEEGTGEDFQQRLKAAGIEGRLLERFHVLFQQGARIDEPRWLGHLEAELKRLGAHACFFDTFSDVCLVDQLDQKTMNLVLTELRGLRVRTECTLVPLMHSPKAVFHGATPPSLADVFGSATAVNKMDFVWLLRTIQPKAQTEDADDAYLAEAAARRKSALVEVHCKKLRSAGAAPPEPRTGQVEVVDVGLDATTARFSWLADGARPSVVKRAMRQGVLEGRILDVLANSPIDSFNELYREMKGNQPALRAAFNGLIQGSRIWRVEGLWVKRDHRDQP